METTFYVASALLILLSILPFIKNQHWVFRVPEFMKIQLFALQMLTLLWGLFFLDKTWIFLIVSGVQLILTLYHLYILIRYTTFYKKAAVPPAGADTASVISCNVYQFNEDYSNFHRLIRKYRPDIFITMESHSGWEKANRTLESDYPYSVKVTLENTYGMHLYSRIPIEKSEVHFFVSDDIPSIEACFRDHNNRLFCIIAVHPPPPSPTEETNSKERDGDLLSVAKKCKENNIPTVVTGDFNTVAWSDTSIIFRKTSGLIDARMGRGILATFHARYWFFRVPLDLLFHSPDIYIDKLETLESVGSDHLPMHCRFYVYRYSHEQEEEEVEHADAAEKQEAEELIREGQKEESNNRGDAP